MIYAASDMAPVLDELGPLFATKTGVALTVNVGATGQLLQQVIAGAPADVFLAASMSALDQLDAKGLLVPESTQIYARGSLVLVSRPGLSPTPTALADLRSEGVGRIALANPELAPYGRAAKEALTAAGLWDVLGSRLVFAESAKQVQQIVGSGNAGVGFVPLSLAIAADEPYLFVPRDLYTPLAQGVAIVAATKREENARAFVAYLTGPDGRALLEKYGFEVPGTP
jgi:molybdate transport system substrate-binding protein